MDVKKKFINGKVAVAVAGLGREGWSTWAVNEYKEFLLFDERIIDFILAENYDAMENLVKVVCEDAVYLKKLDLLEVKWVPLSKIFTVKYDDDKWLERIKIMDSDCYVVMGE